MMILGEKPAAVAVALLLFASQSAHAFLQPAVCPMVLSNKSNTSTQLHLFDIFNAGKKALVRQLAGEYDPVAVSL